MATNKTAFDHMTDDVIKKITESMEKGNTTWVRPWSTAGPNMNPVTKTVYRGVNQFLLSFKGFTDNRWVTPKEIEKLKGHILEGSKVTYVNFWHVSKKIDRKSGLETTQPFFIVYKVLNVEQTNLVEIGALPALVITEKTEQEKIETCEAIINGYKNAPELKHGGNRAYYSPDYIQMPEINAFDTIKSYYVTLFHEQAHSTGHKTRLNRDMQGRFGTGKYAYEELVAELTAVYLAAHAGIDDTNNYDQSAAYLGGWLKALKDNPKMFEKAARDAFVAYQYILGISKKQEEEDTTEEE